MNTSILKLKATVIRPKDDDELDGLAASISFPVECDDEAIGEALGDHDLMAYVVGELHDLVVRMRPEWLDNEDTSLTIYPKSKKVNISSDTISSEAQTSRMPRRRKTGKPPKLKLIIRILRQPLQHKRRSNNV